jgi:hypothetical protein
MIILVPTILYPLIDTTTHVMQPKRIGLETADLDWLLGDCNVIAVLAIGHAGLKLVAPPVLRLRAPTGGIFPFGFAWQPICLEVVPASQAVNCLASLQLTFVTGASSLPVATNAHAFAAAHSFHSRTEIGYRLIANGLIVTWWVGFSVISSLLPMMKLPPRSMFISGSRTADVSGVAGAAGDASGGCDVACFAAGAIEGAG